MKKILEKRPFAELFSFSASGNERIRPVRFLETAETPEGILLYNILTGSMYLLSEAEYKGFRENGLSREETLLMQKEGFYIPEGFDEYAFVRKTRALNRILKSRTSVRTIYTIYPTTACNARCFYCFEEGIRTEYMTKETADAAADYIIRNAKGRPVTLRWFGGEPTLCPDIIGRISGRLSDGGVPFSAHMITNALLLDPAMAEKAVSEWHLKSAQITLDGPKDLYNQTKAYACPCTADPYHTVLDHIETLLRKNVDIHIRVNIGPYNRDELMSLFRELASRFRVYPNFHIFTRLLNEGKLDFLKGEHESLMQTRRELISFLKEQKITPPKERDGIPCFAVHNCFADDPRHAAIAPSGRLYKCADNIKSTPSFGSVFSDDIDEAQVQALARTVDWPGCASCAYYPYCINLKECIARGKSCREDIRKNLSLRCRQDMLSLFKQKSTTA